MTGQPNWTGFLAGALACVLSCAALAQPGSEDGLPPGPPPMDRAPGPPPREDARDRDGDRSGDRFMRGRDRPLLERLRRDRDDSPDSRGGPFRKPLTEEEVEQVLAILQELHPEMAERLTEARKYSPERVQRLLKMMGPRINELRRLKEHDPEMFELKKQDIVLGRETRELAAELREARQRGDEKAVQQSTARMRELVRKHFDVRQQMKVHELEAIERRLEMLREQLKERAAQREQVIESRVEELTGQTDTPPW